MSTRSKEFRYIYANNFGIQATQNEYVIRLGYAENALDPISSTYEEVGVILSLASAKTLARLLSTSIADFEHDTGHTIPVDGDALDALVRAGKHSVPGPAPTRSKRR